MTMNRQMGVVLGIAFCMGAAGVAVAKEVPKKNAKPEAAKQEEAGAAMMAAMEKFATPGENHKRLTQLAGSWNATIKSWFGPGQPKESTGTSEVKAILGDRYIMEDYSG